MTKEYNPKINKFIYTVAYPKRVYYKDSKYVFTSIFEYDKISQDTDIFKYTVLGIGLLLFFQIFFTTGTIF